MEWQIRNWNYFTWLSGDHIVEQHVHNLDIMNWVLGTHPIKAVSGLGGRQSRPGDAPRLHLRPLRRRVRIPERRHDVQPMPADQRHANNVAEFVAGTKGKSNCADVITPNTGRRVAFKDKELRPYQLEHADLIASIRDGKPLNEAQNVAESTMTGIIGREACYSGQEITWDDAMKSTTHLGPKELQIRPVRSRPESHAPASIGSRKPSLAVATISPRLRRGFFLVSCPAARCTCS